MFGIAKIIVGLWFFPVTLFVIIPLAIMTGWYMVMFVNFLRNREVNDND